MTYTVYILLCADKTYYTGITTDINRRIKEHSSGKGARYTRGRQPFQLIYQEDQPNRSEAQKREYILRNLSASQKKELGVRQDS